MPARNKSFGGSKLIAVYEIVHGFLDTILGILLVIFGHTLLRFYINFRTGELLEDPHDLFIRITNLVMPYLSKKSIYIPIIVYFIGFGIARIISGIGILNEKEWGKHLLVGLVILLIPFDLYHLLRHISLLSFGYLVINVVIILYLVQFKPKDYFKELKHYFAKWR